ncbi:RloB family protein [Parabacteroides distasonis]|uniref:RloB family protein n=1 Tax=Parabacteroides distasonis TaxID=823 RepID=UPI001C37F18B|nr:RloB family protein [Parabacteroides distasonis]MBV4225347.1 RloB family protein [Parabacteroides distasonis]
MRERRDFKRPEAKKSSRLVVIAAEGRETEKIYFQGLSEKLCSPKVHVEFLKRNNNNSSPEFVHEQILNFQKEYNISDDDQLWIVIDRDKWSIKSIKIIAQYCIQNPNLFFCLSNPCFELWLLLHKLDINNCTEKEKISSNKKEKKNGETFTKKLLKTILGSYTESKYDVDELLKTLDIALIRAKSLDTMPKSRWPQKMGTRVYRIVESIMDL